MIAFDELPNNLNTKVGNSFTWPLNKNIAKHLHNNIGEWNDQVSSFPLLNLTCIRSEKGNIKKTRRKKVRPQNMMINFK